MIAITKEPIDEQAVLAAVQDNNAGAAVLFLGVTREMTGDRKTASLEYEAAAEMASAKLHELAGEAARRWPILKCSIVHRLGHLAVGEASVAIAVCSPHRRDALEAAGWLIDTLKEVAPIWKKENWADGTSEWVHPGMDSTKSNSSPKS